VTYRWSPLIDAAWERFVGRIHAPGPFECWEWRGGRSIGGQKNKSNHAPYGTFWVAKGFIVRAHIFMLEAAGIFVPPGWHRNHTCHNTLCVNPLHLEPVTAEENYADRRKGVSARWKEAA
jgi:hypothetical protein